ncbi:MAG: hypothetical protein HC877_09090 [Thioploca sp.]|nr:hypothetical protein [Thioploca sp.]
MTYDSQLRQRIAQTSARLMVQEGITDYQQAKHKAAEQLGIPHTRHLPSNSEIEAEILIYQQLFQANTQPYRLHHMREVALQAMQLFAAFTPRLVGSVLQGTAHQYSDITLHLFTHSFEEVALFLLDKKIPYDLTEQRFRLPQLVSFPSFRFMAGEESIVLIVFGIDDIRWSPPSPLDGKPMRRADIRMVEKLLVEPEV